MARKNRKQRLQDQRVRQAALRDEARSNRKPGRDDMARLLLWFTIRRAHTEARRQGRRDRLDSLCSLLATGLADQGFDADAAEELFAMLERKYSTQDAPGRIKRHLGRPAQEVTAPRD